MKRSVRSRSAALRRAIQSAAMQATPADNEELGTLDRLQGRLALDHGAAAGWEDEVKQERRATAERNSCR